MATNCYGSCHAELTTDGLRVGETRPAPALRTPAHTHDCGCLHVVEAPASLAREAARTIDESFREPLRTSKLAASLGVHRSTLARAFRREFDCTVGEYVRARRLDFVRHRLTEDPDGSLASLAVESGFSDQSHMTRWFKAVYGTSPAGLRREHRPGRLPNGERS